MRKYLELTPQLSDITKIKSFLYPYVCVSQDGELQYTPYVNGLEIITHESPKERLLNVGIWEFYIPMLYVGQYSDAQLEQHGRLTLIPADAQSFGLDFENKITIDPSPYYQIYTKSGILGQGTDTTYYYEYSLTDIQAACYNAPLPTLVKVSVNITQPTIAKINISKVVMDAVLDSINHLMQVGDSIIVDKYAEFKVDNYNLSQYPTRYVRWDGDEDLSITLSGNLIEDTPSDASGSVIVPAHGAASLINALLLLIPRCSKWEAVCNSTGTLSLSEFEIDPLNNALLLNKSEVVDINNENIVYCIGSQREKDDALKFIHDGSITSITLSDTPDFDNVNNLVLTVNSETIKGEHGVYITNTEKRNIMQSNDQEYIYIKFNIDQPCNVYYDIWETGNQELVGTTKVSPNNTISIAANSTSKVYRIKYDEWKSGMILNWSGTRANTMYVGDKPNFPASSTSENMILSQSIASKTEYIISKEEMLQFESRVDEFGYLYLKFNTRSKGNMVFSELS